MPPNGKPRYATPGGHGLLKAASGRQASENRSQIYPTRSLAIFTGFASLREIRLYCLTAGVECSR